MRLFDKPMNETVLEKISQGMLANSGVYSTEDIHAAVDLVRQLASDNIETTRLVFPDQHGILRGKTVSSRVLPGVFAKGLGIPSTLLLKDTAHKTVFDIWSGNQVLDGLPVKGAGDLLMVPLPQSFRTVPWSTHSSILMCDLVHRSGTAVSFSSRSVLQSAAESLANAGYEATFGLEVEFQIFERLNDSLEHDQATIPPSAILTRNLTQGWQYLTETRYGEVEELLDTLRRHSEALGLEPRTMEIEMGPSQFEFTFEPSNPLQQADRYVLFRTMVKEVCQRRGLAASFMAKPRFANSAANGWHIHQSLSSKESKRNVFTPKTPDTLTDQASGWISGLLTHAQSSCLLTTPTVNGYKRYTPYQLAPNRIQWGTDNRGAMIRALLYPGDESSRIENRAPDTSANPYFAMAAQLLAGLDGIKRGAVAPPMTSTPYDEAAEKLPSSLIEAIEAFESSALFREMLGDEFVQYLAHIKRSEWKRYLAHISEWEQDEYFGLY